MDICIEHLPVRELRPYVQCVWYSPATDDTEYEIVPDGCVDACFVLSETNPRTLLYGTTTHTTASRLEAGAPYFGVRFRPGKASVFVREKISELTDAQIPVRDFLGLSAEEVLCEGTFVSRRRRIEALLLSTLANGNGLEGDALSYAVATIDASHGEIRVRHLAARCNLSERQLERLFLERVGLSPKRYARVQRFRSVLHHLEDLPEPGRPRLADVAALFGYADQSHLHRDFKEFAHPIPLLG
jgi:AraC-like DNA-binding protein